MKKIISLLLIFAFLTSATPVGLALDMDKTAEYIKNTVTEPTVGSIGGEWAVIGLARSGTDMEQSYWDGYYTRVSDYVSRCEGVLHSRKYTEYSRVALALTAIGADPRNVAGYDILAPLGDFDKTVWQGINGPVWALMALDSGNYPMPEGTATRQRYVEEIVCKQLPDGGWNLSGTGYGDSDITGMALTALANYKAQPHVQQTIDKALVFLENIQLNNGGFAAGGEETAESSAQVMTALCTLGIGINDERFVKNGNTVLDALLAHRRPDGSFEHIRGKGTNLMATEQAFYALAAHMRYTQNKSPLYKMDDVKIAVTGVTASLSRHEDVRKNEIILPNASFSDINGHENQTAIETLASYGIITGRGDGTFDPDATMTRSEFAAIVVRALGLTPEYRGAFTDVEEGKWFSGYIGTAYEYGVVNGRGDGTFGKELTITKQEAAAMVARGAALCGMDTERDSTQVLNMLAQFGDYVTVSDWAREPMAFCYDEDILDQSELNIEPVRNILRCEIAQMLYNMLTKADLI